MSISRAAQRLALGVLASLPIAAGPSAGVFAVLTALAVAAFAAGEVGVTVIIHWPRWVFTALAVPEDARIPAPSLALAWWMQPDGSDS